MARTMEDLRAPAPSWSADLHNYEQIKRRAVDERLLRGPPPRITAGQVKSQERFFDPMLQRYRDGGTELQQRTLEERERVAHLNRAKDIQILREQPFDIIQHQSKLEAIAPGLDPEKLNRQPQGRGGAKMPDTAVDYNLVSNLPFEVHHWASEDRRPRCHERSQAKPRLVPAHNVKDFNVVTNRYLNAHEQRASRDHRLNLLDATQKYNVQNRFDPVMQQFTDPRQEERSRVFNDAHDVEVSMLSHAQLPPSYKARESVGYDVVTHQVTDGSLLNQHDRLGGERKARYGNRYIAEHNSHVQDLKHDHITNVRKLNRAAPERFEEGTRRGFDIVSNQRHGHGPGAMTNYAAWPSSRSTPWETATMQSSASSLPGRQSRSSSGRPRSASALLQRRPSTSSGRSHRSSHSRHHR